MAGSIAEVNTSRIALEVFRSGRVEALLSYRIDLLSYAARFGQPVASRRYGSLLDRLVPRAQEKRGETPCPHSTAWEGSHFTLMLRIFVCRRDSSFFAWLQVRPAPRILCFS